MADLKIAHHFVPDTTVEGMYRYLMMKLAPLKKLRIERPSADTLVIHHKSSPGWTWIRMFETATVIGEDVKGGARFTATGQTSGQALVQIYRAFSRSAAGAVSVSRWGRRRPRRCRLATPSKRLSWTPAR